VPQLPGVATATELMWGLKAGYAHFKLFPANVVGGVEALKAFASPFPQAQFCPTGGVNAKNAPDYLALPNVICVGGSWVAPADAVAAGDWARITELARAAAGLARPVR
jgi:2-dehydro-3-deoxyphosphogluconate aldolase/(4S)-4-hydroxy-2-oxoglutarate aldolase